MYLSIIIFGLIILSQLREKKIRIKRLWVLPALMGYLCLSTINQMKNLIITYYIFFIFMIVLGIGIGLIRGKIYDFRIDKETGQIFRKGNFTTIIFMLLILFLKIISQHEFILASHQNFISIIQAGFLLELFGAFSGRNIMFYLRSRKLYV